MRRSAGNSQRNWESESLPYSFDGGLTPRNAQFVKVDTTSWDDQVNMFKAAIAHSPNHSVDVVIANAGVGGMDSLFAPSEGEDPTKPDLRTMDVNVYGNAYTARLAHHYMPRQPETPDRDRCLIFTCSMAAYNDQPMTLQYNVSKYAMRALMKTYRRTSWKAGIRVNAISPR